MKTLLVLAEHPRTAGDVLAGTSPEAWRVVHRTNPADAEPLLIHGLVHACVLDLPMPDVQGIWAIEKIRKWAPHCPVLILTTGATPEWTEQAYLAGAAHVLERPARPQLIAEMLARIERPSVAGTFEDGDAEPQPEQSNSPQTSSLGANPQVLATLRGFSGILTHSLDEPGLLKQFLLYIREMFGLNRAAIFLTQPGKPLLRPASAIGISQQTLEAVGLSTEMGVGHIACSGARIVRRRGGPSHPQASVARKELQALGVEVAIPILDKEQAIGVALLDARVTGETLSNSELEMLFHLLEQLGMGLRNIGLHEQLSSNSQMLTGVLRELSSACVVLSSDLRLLHANKAAKRFFFGGVEHRLRDFGFEDLPEEIGAKAYQVLQTGTALVNHRQEMAKPAGGVFKLNIVPFQNEPSGHVQSVVIMAEDLTQAEQLRKLEAEAADLQLMRKMADRMSAEIGNAIMPVSTYQQLLTERWKDAEFRSSMNEELTRAVSRIDRLLKQMRYLSGQHRTAQDHHALKSVLEEGYQEACKYQTLKPAKLKLETKEDSLDITGDGPALRYAFTEILLNALLASPGEQSITVRAAKEPESPGMVRVEIQDKGEGFAPEVANHATEPFFSTKPVGVGLGLTVARRIIEANNGRLEIQPQTNGNGRAGLVRVYLPVR